MLSRAFVELSDGGDSQLAPSPNLNQDSRGCRGDGVRSQVQGLEPRQQTLLLSERLPLTHSNQRSQPRTQQQQRTWLGRSGSAAAAVYVCGASQGVRGLREHT